MKRIYFKIFLIALFLYCFTSHAQSNWQSLESSDGLYRVALPAQYSQTTDTISRTFGTVMVYNFSAFEVKDSMLYNFMDMHYPSSVNLSEDQILADSILQINLREIAKQLDGNVIYQAQLESDHRGLQARITTGSDRIVRIKMHALANRFLLQQVHGYSAKVNKEKTEIFFKGLYLYPDNYRIE